METVQTNTQLAPNLSATSSTQNLVVTSVHRKDASFPGSFAAVAREEAPTTVGPWYRQKEYFTEGWTDPRIWRSAVIELIATAMLTFLTASITITFSNYDTKQIGAYLGISNTIVLSLFIYAVAPSSGAHLNPLITWTAMLAGLCPFARGSVYIVAQLIGGAVGGAFMAASLGFPVTIAHKGGGCFFDPDVTTVGQAFATEFWASYTLVFIAFGVGLDPRQAKLFGSSFSPFLVGLTLGVISFGLSGVTPGSTGANMNPARCFGVGIARQSFESQWIWWIAPAVAGVLQSLTYNLIPPYHAEKVPRHTQHSHEHLQPHTGAEKSV